MARRIGRVEMKKWPLGGLDVLLMMLLQSGSCRFRNAQTRVLAERYHAGEPTIDAGRCTT